MNPIEVYDGIMPYYKEAFMLFFVFCGKPFETFTIYFCCGCNTLYRDGDSRRTSEISGKNTHTTAKTEKKFVKKSDAPLGEWTK